MRLRHAVAVSCIAGALTLGCARQRGGGADLPLPAPVTLEVTNNNWADMAVYVVHSGQRIRIMTVVTTNTVSVTLLPDQVGPGGEVRILARPLGGAGRFLGPVIFASPGQTVAVTLENDLNQSTVSTR